MPDPLVLSPAPPLNRSVASRSSPDTPRGLPFPFCPLAPRYSEHIGGDPQVPRYGELGGGTSKCSRLAAFPPAVSSGIVPGLPEFFLTLYPHW